MKKEDLTNIFLGMIIILLIVLVILISNNYTKERENNCPCREHNLPCYMGCDNSTNSNYTEIGVITQINPNGEYGTILIEKDQFKASIKIIKNTEIVYKLDDKINKFSDLKIGMEIEVVFDGPVAESYPLQGTAKAIYIIKK